MLKKLILSLAILLGLSVAGVASADYCVPELRGGGPSDLNIARVLLTGSNGTLDSISAGSTNSPSYYEYFSGAFVPVLLTGETYSVYIEIGDHIFGDVNIAAWYDFDGDQTFSAGDKIGQTDNMGPNSGSVYSFTIPTTGTTSFTRLRVMSQHSDSSFDPCAISNLIQGETEDYDIQARYVAPLVGGGKRYIPKPDNCPEGDFSATQYDSLCSGMSATNGILASTGLVITGSVATTGSVSTWATVSTWDIEDDLEPVENPEEMLSKNACRDSETQNAFVFARMKGITTMPDCQSAQMGGFLLRKHAAKMIVNFAKNVLGKEADITRICIFNDMPGEGIEMQQYAIEACQLGIMGLKWDGSPADKFNPNEYLDKAQYSTMISRLLYGEKNNDTACRYCKHVETLYTEGIISRKEGLAEPFQRGPAMIMMMRVGTRIKN